MMMMIATMIIWTDTGNPICLTSSRLYHPLYSLPREINIILIIAISFNSIIIKSIPQILHFSSIDNIFGSNFLHIRNAQFSQSKQCFVWHSFRNCQIFLHRHHGACDKYEVCSKVSSISLNWPEQSPCLIRIACLDYSNYSMIVWNWNKVNSYISALKPILRLSNSSEFP